MKLIRFFGFRTKRHPSPSKSTSDLRPRSPVGPDLLGDSSTFRRSRNIREKRLLLQRVSCVDEDDGDGFGAGEEDEDEEEQEGHNDVGSHVQVRRNFEAKHC